MSRFSSGVLFLAMLGLSLSAQADRYGPLDGRSPDPSQTTKMSVEVGFVSEGDFSNLTGRFIYQFSPLVSVYGDFGTIERTNDEGTAFGIGATFYLAKQRIMPVLDIGVRASYHMASVDNGIMGGTESDISDMAVAVHVGSKEAFFSYGMKWYGVLSYHRSGVESLAGTQSFDSSSSDVGLGAGVYMPVGAGEAYVGIENLEEIYVGVGYRYFLGGGNY